MTAGEDRAHFALGWYLHRRSRRGNDVRNASKETIDILQTRSNCYKPRPGEYMGSNMEEDSLEVWVNPAKRCVGSVFSQQKYSCIL